jgi:hypothetical protein
MGVAYGPYLFWSLTAQNIGPIYSELSEKLKKLEKFAHFTKNVQT